MSGWTARALLDTCLVGTAAALIATAVATALAWITERTDLGRARRLAAAAVGAACWPSYLESLGWTWLVEPQGVLSPAARRGPGETLRGLVFGPVGVIWVLASRGVPFAYLAVSALVRGMGREFEDAARTHGASRLATARLLLPILAPGLWAGFAIVFAESISDYGVAATLAAQANFPLVTGAMEQSVSTFPAQFQLASAMGWLLLGLVALALLAQRRSMRGRSFTVLSDAPNGSPIRSRLSLRGQLGALAGVGGFFVLALGVPAFGAAAAAPLPSGGKVSLSTLTLANFRQVLHSGEMLSALGYSARMSAITACAALVLGAFAGRALASARRRSRRAAARPAACWPRSLLLLGPAGQRLHLHLQPAARLRSGRQPVRHQHPAGPRLPGRGAALGRAAVGRVARAGQRLAAVGRPGARSPGRARLERRGAAAWWPDRWCGPG